MTAKGRMGAVAPLAAAAMAVAGCDDDPVQVCCIDQESFAVVEATVLDAGGAPLPSARVTAGGHPEACAQEQAWAAIGGSALADENGRIVMTLTGGLIGPDVHCVYLMVDVPGLARVDTLGGYDVQFHRALAPSDTVRLTLETSLE